MSKGPFRLAFLALVPAFCLAFTGNTFLGKPLFNYDIDKNRLTLGSCEAVRSYRETTQLLVSRNHWDVALFTDRENGRDSRITAVSWSRLALVPPRREAMGQAEFSARVVELITRGSGKTAERFAGLEDFLSLGKGSRLTKTGSRFEGEISGPGGVTMMDLDFLEGNLSIMKKRALNGPRREVVRYPVYIRETRDREIRRVINLYNLKFRSLINTNNSSSAPKS